MRFLGWFGAVLAALVGVVVLAFVFPGAWLPPLVEDRLTERLGREVEVGGARVSLDPLRITLSDVKVANPDWAAEPWLLEAARLDAHPVPDSLLALDPAFDQLRFEQAALHLFRHPEHGPSWQLAGGGDSGGGQGSLPVERVIITDGRLEYRAPGRETEVAGSLRSPLQGDRLHVDLSGTWRGQPARLEGWTARLLELRGANRVAVGFDGRVGETAAQGTGALSGLGAEGGPFFDLELRASGPTLAAWNQILPANLPATPPYDLQGGLSYDGQRYALRHTAGRIGDSDVAGRLTVEPGTPTVISGEIDSRHLEMADALAIGGEDGDGGGGLLPGGLQLDLDMSADEVATAWRMLSKARAQVTLRDDRLSLEPVSATVGGGRVSGRVTLDDRRQPPQLATRLDLERMRLDETLGTRQVTQGGLTGLYGGRVDLAGDWQGIDGWLGTLDGTGTLVVSDGQLGTDALDQAAVGFGDLFGMLTPEGQEQPSAIRCAVVDAAAQGGVMQARTAYLSASSAVVTADGTVDLGARRLDLMLNIQPRGPQVITFAGDVAVTGPLTDPTVDPQVAGTVMEAAAGMALGALSTPLAALVPLADMGTGDATGCRAMLQDVQEASEKAAGDSEQGAD